MLDDGIADQSKQESGICAPVNTCLVAVKDDSAALHACRATRAQTGLASVSPQGNASTSKVTSLQCCFLLGRLSVTVC